MTESVCVTIVSSVYSAFNRGAESGIFLLVRLTPQAPAEEVLPVVRAAVATANGGVEPLTVHGLYATATPRGCAVHLHGEPRATREQRDRVEAWLTSFADELTDAGSSGRISASGSMPPIGGHVGGIRTYPAAFVGYSLDNYAPWGESFCGWQVAEETTRVVAAGFADRAEATHAQCWAKTGGSVPITTSEVVDFLATTARWVVTKKGVFLLYQGHEAFEQCLLSSRGQCVTQAVRPDLDWRTLVDEQLRFLLLAPDRSDVGMIKNAWESAWSWDGLRVRDRHEPVRLPLDYELNRHLWDEYVIDAAGISLLTGKHVGHAHDLSDWTVEEVARDRFLVTAHDLEPWYGGIAAPPDVIAKARADFGDMILTWDTILAKPGPYTITDPRVVGR